MRARRTGAGGFGQWGSASPTSCVVCQRAEANADTPSGPGPCGAFGPRRLLGSLLCPGCDGRLRATVDGELEGQLEALRSVFAAERDPAWPGPASPGAPVHHSVVSLREGARLDLVPSPFTFRRSGDDAFTIHIAARSEDELARCFARSAAALNMTVGQLAERAARATDGADPRLSGVGLPALSIGGRGPSRSLMKSALLLWAAEVGNEEIRKPCYAAARRFILDEGPGPDDPPVRIDGRPLGGRRAIEDEFGRLFNLLAVASDGQGRVNAYACLYGFYGVCLTVAAAGGVRGRKASLVVDALDPRRWSRDRGRHLSADAAWMGCPELPGDLGSLRDALAGAEAEHARATGRRAALERAHEVLIERFPCLGAAQGGDGSGDAEVAGILADLMFRKPREEDRRSKSIFEVMLHRLIHDRPA